MRKYRIKSELRIPSHATLLGVFCHLYVSSATRLDRYFLSSCSASQHLSPLSFLPTCHSVLWRTLRSQTKTSKSMDRRASTTSATGTGGSSNSISNSGQNSGQTSSRASSRRTSLRNGHLQQQLQPQAAPAAEDLSEASTSRKKRAAAGSNGQASSQTVPDLTTGTVVNGSSARRSLRSR